MPKNHRLNGLAKWIIVALVLGGIAYDIINTRAMRTNDIKHLQKDNIRIEAKVDRIIEYLMEK